MENRGIYLEFLNGYISKFKKLFWSILKVNYFSLSPIEVICKQSYPESASSPWHVFTFQLSITLTTLFSSMSPLTFSTSAQNIYLLWFGCKSSWCRVHEVDDMRLVCFASADHHETSSEFKYLGTYITYITGINFYKGNWI